MRDYRLLVLAVGAACALESCTNEATEPNAVPVTATAAALQSNTWLVRRDLPYEWKNVITAMIPDSRGGSKLYAIGGNTGTGACLGRVRAYDVTTNVWSRLADLPTALCGINGAGVIDGKIYLAGGAPRARSTSLSAALFVYDPATNVWTQKRSMPEGGSFGLAGVIKGKLYVVTNTRTASRLFRYDPVANTWQTLPSTAFYWLGGGGGVIDGKLYLIAQAVKVYDPSTNQWTTRGPLPGDLHGVSAVVSSRLYVFGADTKTGSEEWGIFIYDPVGNAWSRKPLLTTLQDSYNFNGGHRVIVSGRSRVEVVGGGSPGNNLQYVP